MSKKDKEGSLSKAFPLTPFDESKRRIIRDGGLTPAAPAGDIFPVEIGRRMSTSSGETGGQEES